jgi:hypothetical protein
MLEQKISEEHGKLEKKKQMMDLWREKKELAEKKLFLLNNEHLEVTKKLTSRIEDLEREHKQNRIMLLEKQDKIDDLQEKQTGRDSKLLEQK